MKKNAALILSVILLSVVFYSCNKSPAAIEKLKQSCLYSNTVNYFQKWSNTFTEVDIYNTKGTIQSSSFIYPYGYFKLNSDFSYNVESDGVPLSGKWDISDSCQLVLDPGKVTQRSFDVLKLSADSLTIRRKDGSTVYTQHYIVFKCPDVSKLEYQWDNTFTVESFYNTNAQNAVYSSVYIYPIGYFKLNADASYNVLSNGASLNGNWQIDPTTCKLVLDKSTSLERAFDIQQLTTDSLTIWRKDTINMVDYLQHYKKH